MGERKLKFVMYPWLAMGHLTTYLHISNKLAERGHKIFFILPKRTQSKLDQFNHHPDRIIFVPITVPHVEGLPEGAETTADIPFPLGALLRHAMDLTEPTIESLLQEIKPQFVFYDFTYWLPAMARRMGIKTIHYCIISPASMGYLLRHEPNLDAFLGPPVGFPPSTIKLYEHEVRSLKQVHYWKEHASDITFVQRMMMSNDECDALGFKSCREMEGHYCEFLEKRYNKPVFLAGPVLPEPPTVNLDETWKNWFDQFKPKSVIFCAFGSEARLSMDQFQELVLGLELTGFPFLAALKPPAGSDTVEEALPEGFKLRTEKRGVIHGGWVQQQLILSHPSVGCFITHCGSGSLSEAMVNECQLVLLPHVGDHIINARLMGGDLRVGLEVRKGEEDGRFTKEEVMKTVKLVMDDENEIGREIRANHGKWRDFLLTKGLENSYMDGFVNNLRTLLE
ncbi:UDP-Glycosyltransferase superfamily protein [Dorcoceras hygrometricum]|uniref:Glycosyltransferase n=2 Tax=Dorcoceras hygrometricum TaxID=472368 RepID=A0A2Z7CMZ6_9LAMI|nr:UDP-Glycosyltransferase superfamily protein [Dorcoceras hygrometricum]